MLIALCFSALLQAQPASEASSFSHRPALPILTVKAPGKPEYGIHISAPQGQFIFTNLSYTPAIPKGSAALYHITGPGGLGPYRLDAELKFMARRVSYMVSDPEHTKTYVFPRFAIMEALKNGAARAAGLNEDWYILEVDGKNFGWDLNAIMEYISNRPSVEVVAVRHTGWGSKKNQTFQIQLRKLDVPTNEAVLIPEQPKVLQPHLNDPRLWSELITLRSALPRFTPLPVDLGGKQRWAVRGVKNPQPSHGEQPDRITLELWGEDPSSGPTQPYPSALWVEPEDGLRKGRVLRAEDRWYQVQEAGVDADSGRLLKLTLRPWTVDVTGLLVGTSPALTLGPGATLSDREALEEYANDAMVEWKTRTLPGRLTTQGLEATEDLVIRIEKGLLKLDLEVKGIRSRIDATARAEAERKAQAELAARDGKAAPQVQAAPVTESERLADLLDQRKAILMAILGSAKQALAQQRR